MNIKKLVFILIGVVLICFGVGFLSLKLSKNNNFNIISDKTNSNEKYNIIDEKDEVSIEGIKEINIDADIADIKITSEDREDVSFHFHGEASPHIKTSFNIKKSGNKLIAETKTKTPKAIFNTSTNTNLYLDVVIPSSYNSNLSIITDLGSINIDGIKLNKLNIQEDLGDINIKNTDLKELEADSSLGKIFVENVSSLKNKLSTDLGAVNVKSIEGPIEAETNLGNIELEYDNINWDIDAKSDSGNIKILLPKNSNFTIDASTDLGNIKNSFPLDTSENSGSKLKGKVGDGKNMITLSVNLGNIDINSK